MTKTEELVCKEYERDPRTHVVAQITNLSEAKVVAILEKHSSEWKNKHGDA